MKNEREYRSIKSMYSFWGRSGLYGLGAFLTFLGRERRIRQKCVEQLQLPAGGRVIDIACGTGRNHPYLVEAVGEEGEVVGFDYTSEMLERARSQAEARGWRNITLLQGDAAEIQLPPESFDGVIGVLGFSVIPNHEEAIQRAVGLLKENARIVICDAVPFQGAWGVFNFLTVPLFRRLACWNTEKDLLGALDKYAKRVDLQWFNGRSIYIATSMRASDTSVSNRG